MTTEVARRPLATAGRAEQREVNIIVHKRGRGCNIGKLAYASPLTELVLAMPYRHRQAVEHVSLPPKVLAYARQAGARLWIVRLDGSGGCFGLPLSEVERRGWLRPSDGSPEWFLPLSAFRPIAWQDWEYVPAEQRIEFGGAAPAEGRQPSLPGLEVAG